MDAATLAKMTDLGALVAELRPETEVAGHGHGIVELTTPAAAAAGRSVRVWVDDLTLCAAIFRNGGSIGAHASFANLPAAVTAYAVAAMLDEAGR